MTLKRHATKLALVLLLSCSVSLGCSDDRDVGVRDSGTADGSAADAGKADGGDKADAGKEPQVGFEILQIRSPTEIVVWLSVGTLTKQQFEALQVSPGWFKNQPREGEADGGSFARSPGASADGQFTDEEHFGYKWRHNATVIEANTPLDKQGLLRLNRVAKYHEISFNAGRNLWILVSPKGEPYVRVTRDANRKVETPTLPSDWKLVQHTITEKLTLQLPNPTDNIRCDNEDSFQGPVEALKSVVGTNSP